MSHLEEVLTEFRKGTKIRRKCWEDKQYVFLHPNGSIYLATGRLFKFDTDHILSDDWEFYQEPIGRKEVIKVGQIYKQKNNEIFIVTLIQDGDVFLIYDDGYNASYPIEAVNSPIVFDKLIAEYPTWKEAVNSPEFRGENNAGQI